jgi:hypothetical protein
VPGTDHKWRLARGYRPEYECRPWKYRFTIVKLNNTAENPMMARTADRDPRHPRVARAWMYPAKMTQTMKVQTSLVSQPQ